MLIILETSRAEAAYDLHINTAHDLLQTDAARRHFARRAIPLMRRLRSHSLPPNIQQILVDNLIRDAVLSVTPGRPYSSQATVHADNT